MKNLQRLGALLVIIGAVFLVYWPAQRNGFVWDDTALIARDPLIRSWRLIPEAFRHFLFIDATASNFYRPLQRLSFMADYAFWDMNAAGFHLTSIYLHMAAALALFFLVEKLLASTPRRSLYALGVALLWAIHPLHTSAVTYIAGRADPLAALFGFSALGLGLVSLERQGRRAIPAMAGAALCFLAALLSKESGIFALLIWFLLLLWRKEARPIFLRWAMIGAVVLLGYGALRTGAAKIPPPERTASSQGTARLTLVTRALAEYAVLFAAPTNLHMERDVSDRAERGGNGALKTGIGTLVVIGMMGWGWWTKHHAPVATFGLTAFAAAYLPVSNLFSLNATVAEHWLYVPSAFLLIALAATAERFLHGRQRSWPFLVCVGAWAVMLGVCTRAQQGYWFNQRAFFSGTIAAGGDSARMHVNMGNLEARDGHPDLAMEHYHQALRRQPELAFALLGMASLELRRDNPAEARRLLQRAAKEPFFAPECLQLQAAVEFRESKRETTELLRRALELAPNRWPFRMRYLTALEQNGRRAEAVNELRDFLTREPFRAESWQLLGDLLANQHQPQLAIAAFERAIELDVHATEAAVRIELLRRINKLAPH